MKLLSGIYPKVIPDEIARAYNRKPEIDVYNALSVGLGKEFYIFYNCDWYDPTKEVKGSRDGEADFIVAHPSLGFICLEVKGGDVGRDAETRQWYRLTNSGRKSIKNPIAQAKRSKHVVLELLKSNWEGDLPYIRAKHGVILPNAGKPKALDRLGADMPLDLFAFFEDMDALDGRVVQIFLGEPEGGNPNYAELGDKGIIILHELFQRELKLPVSIGAELDHYDRRLTSLTEEQEEYLGMADAHDRLLLLGGAGSGKTFLAQKKAVRDAESGLNTLLIVFNSALAKYLRTKIEKNGKLKIASFHEFCRWCCDQAGVEFKNNDSNERRFFEDVSPTLLLDALDQREDIRYQSLVVDEAQDHQRVMVGSVVFCAGRL